MATFICLPTMFILLWIRVHKRINEFTFRKSSDAPAHGGDDPWFADPARPLTPTLCRHARRENYTLVPGLRHARRPSDRQTDGQTPPYNRYYRHWTTVQRRAVYHQV